MRYPAGVSKPPGNPDHSQLINPEILRRLLLNRTCKIIDWPVAAALGLPKPNQNRLASLPDITSRTAPLSATSFRVFSARSDQVEGLKK